MLPMLKFLRENIAFRCNVCYKMDDLLILVQFFFQKIKTRQQKLSPSF
jgi:hypothetical protein